MPPRDFAFWRNPCRGKNRENDFREINAVFLCVCKINVRFIISEKRKKMDFTLQLSTINAFKFIIEQYHCYGYVLWFGLSKKVVPSCI